MLDERFVPARHGDPVPGPEHEIRPRGLYHFSAVDPVDVNAYVGKHALDVLHRVANGLRVGPDLKRPDVEMPPRVELIRRTRTASHGCFVRPAFGRQINTQDPGSNLREEPGRCNHTDEVCNRERNRDLVGESGTDGFVHGEMRYGIGPGADRRGFREGSRK